MDLWAELADERRLVADDLSGLPDEAWHAPTTCGSWTVQELVAHLTVPLTIRPVELLPAIVRGRGSVDRAIAAMTLDRASTPAADLLRLLREKAHRKVAPPGLGPVAPLTDCVVHGIELRRATGVHRAVAPARLRAALDFVTSRRSVAFGSGKRARGRRLEATDLDWSFGPVGAPTTRRRADDLLLAVTGREEL